MAESESRPLECASCGTEISPVLLSCPVCRRLVHATELKQLAADASKLEEHGEIEAALAAWRQALALLPAETYQHETVAASVARLSASASSQPARKRESPRWIRQLGPIGILVFGVWKLLGIAKLGSFLSLAASFAVYWSAWGWRFAAGFLGSMYLHELGHVWALRRAGIPASPPMFIPGFGAYVRMHHAPPDARTNAFVGLAGPTLGLLLAAVLFALSVATGSFFLRALAHAGAILNLFNLVPLWSLDGARGIAPITQTQRFLLVVAAGCLLAITHEGILWLVLIAGALQTFSSKAPSRADHAVFAVYGVMLAGLSLLALYARGA